MKRRLFVNAAAFAFAALAVSPPQAWAGMNDIRASDNAIWGAVGADSFAYKESVPAPDLPDSERDWIPSAAAGFNYLGAGNTYFGLEGTFAYGNANYTGAYLYAPTTPLHGTTRETISTVDGKIGQAVPLGSGAMLIPYAELGFRYWDRSFGSIEREDYQNFDALGGLMLQVSPASGWVLSVYGAGGTTFSPEMKTAGVTFDLGDSAMYKIGGKIGCNIAERTELFTTLDYENFHYGQSPVIGGFYEPSSRTNETAARIGLAYHFE